MTDIENKEEENADGTFQGLCKPDKKATGFSWKNDDKGDELRSCKDGRLGFKLFENNCAGRNFSKIKTKHHPKKSLAARLKALIVAPIITGILRKGKRPGFMEKS